ncbi:MAG: cytochrome oxidase subunit III, partial [Acidobacteria bacterium]
MESGAHTATMEAGWGGGAAPFGATWQKTMMWIFIVTDALLFS